MRGARPHPTGEPVMERREFLKTAGGGLGAVPHLPVSLQLQAQNLEGFSLEGQHLPKAGLEDDRRLFLPDRGLGRGAPDGRSGRRLIRPDS